MGELLACSALAVTVTLAVSRPRVSARGLRFTPGAAALIGVTTLVLAGLLRAGDLVSAARVQWRPLLALTCIMTMTGVVQEVGAFDRLARVLERYARRTSATRVFAALFALTVVTASVLNNDSAILLLTPLVVALARRAYPGRPAVAEAFAFVVFLAPGVAPFVVSNPMNLVVAELSGIGFNEYAAVMAPISVAGAALTYVVLRFRFRRVLAEAPVAPERVELPPGRPGERAAVGLLLGVFAAYPIVASAGAPIWPVAVVGAVGALLLAWRYRVASPRRLVRHVSVDVLVFLWGVFLVVVGLRHAGVVDRLAALYDAQPAGSARELAVVGVTSALGSAFVDNHPMAMLNLTALGTDGGRGPLLAALVGGDIGPRLLPIGSLAGLLWMRLVHGHGVEISAARFIRIGALVLVPTLTLSLAMLGWLSPP